MATEDILIKIYENYLAYSAKVKERIIKNKMATRIQKMATAHMQMKGSNSEFRVKNTIRQSLTVVANMITREGTELKAYNVLTDFL